MPNSDPASLNVALTISGLSNTEATAVVNNLPAGSTATIEVTKPALGGKRFQIAAEGLSVQAAKEVATALYLHCDRVLNGVVKHLARYAENRPVCCGRSISDLPGTHEITVTESEVTCQGNPDSRPNPVWPQDGAADVTYGDTAPSLSPEAPRE